MEESASETAGGAAPARAAEWVMRGIAYVLGAALLGLIGYVVVERFRYPIDAEWMTGAVRDGVDRLRDGKPLYAEPTAEYIPFIYTPLYMWIASLLAHVMSTMVACKLVSLAATAATAWGIWRIARALGATRSWSGIGLLCYVASYPLTTMFYDLERVDTLSAAFVVVGIAVLVSRPSLRVSALAGAVLGAAFFAKQPGLGAFVAVVVGLALARERRRTLVVAGSGTLTFIVLFAYLQYRTGSWFQFYCLTLPSGHGLSGPLLTEFFILDMPKCFTYSVASIAVAAPVLWASVFRRGRYPWQDIVVAASIGAGMFEGFFMRAHLGGWPNVLVTWLPLACAAVAIGATRAEAWAEPRGQRRVVAMVILGGVALQLLGSMFDPNDNSPEADDIAEQARLTALVHDFEKTGPVLLTTTGGVTTPSSAHAAALFDIVRAGRSAPSDLLRNLEDRRYSALIMGAPDEYLCKRQACEELSMAIVRNYFVAARRHERGHTGMAGFDARPRWILRPRKVPLPPDDIRLLFERMHIEMGLAEAKLAEFSRDGDVQPSDEIEAMAAAEMLAHPLVFRP